MSDWRAAAEQHARAEFPREACGLVVRSDEGERYIAARNVAPGFDSFTLSAEDYAAAEELGEVVALFHSHPNAPCHPSEADRVSCEASGLPWHVIGLPSGAWGYCAPCGYRAPLVGRQFYHGILDCYALVRDFYAWELGIELPNYDRTDEWWKRGQNLYLDNLANAGFRRVDDLRHGDMLLMQIHADVPNHAAVYLDGGKILHHLHGRLSCRDVYGGYWRKHTRAICRHEKRP